MNGPSEQPFVSIIIPCRNEEKFIGKCLESILKSDYDQERIEILVVDGMSDDQTRASVESFCSKHKCVRLHDNPGKIVPSALNTGIEAARGEIIIRMDAHNIYPEDYISKCVRYLEEYGVDNVGGVWITLPGADTHVAKSIALAISHPFAAGNAYYRIGAKEPTYVDTVPFGCYRRDVFDRIGLFDEELIRNQDDEFNLRLLKSGGRILLAPEIYSYYFARDSIKKVWKMYFQYGYFKPLVVKKIGKVLTIRQLIPAAFILVLVFSFLLSFLIKPFAYLFGSVLSVYLLVNFGFSFHIAYKNSFFRHLLLPVIFGVIHFAYGIGYLKGIADFIFSGDYRKKISADMPLTR
jgi:glycosyltransferase involved in cell wall biosynthesis